MDLSIIIPVYNEVETLELLYKRTKDVVSTLCKSYEIIFINDGSTDQSLNIIKLLSNNDHHVQYIDFSRNFGHQIALFAGIENAKGNAVVLMDADLQDPPELIKDLYHKYQEGYQVVYAQRIKRKGENWFKLLCAKLFYRLLNTITPMNIPLDTGDYRILDRKIITVLKQMPEYQKFLRGQIAWIGFKQTAISYIREERYAGKSNYSFRKLLKLAFDGITSFSEFPLRLATYMGFIISGIAFLIMLWALYYRFIVKDYIQGWTSLIISIMFIGGIQLICFGLIGEYLGRMGENIRKRPLYIVNESKFNNNE